jgi:hypothetical protein
MQQCLDFVEDIKDLIRDKNDIKPVEDMTTLASNAVKDSIKIFETVGEDVVDANMEID